CAKFQASAFSGPGTRNASRKLLSAKKDPRLVGDLRQHRRRHRAGGARLDDEAPELLDARRLPLDPVLRRRGYVRIAQAAEEIEPKLLEVAFEARDQQPFPRIGGEEARARPVSPIEAGAA